MKLNKALAFAAAVGVAVAGIAFSAPASAEPVSNSYSLTGSDTLQDVLNAITNGTSAGGSLIRATSNGSTLGNFDAFGGAFIQTKPNGVYFQRPNGSSAGVSSLRASITGNNFGTPPRQITGQVDIARTSAGPGVNANVNGLLVYVPFARDAVSYAYKLGTGVTAGAAAGIEALTTAQLTALYNGTSTTTVGGATVVPRLPLDTSGTRNFFVAALGLTTATLGAGIQAASAGVPENDANQLNPISGTIQIIPFSVAQWVAQSNGFANTDSTLSPGALIGSANGIAPFTGTRPNLVPSPAFYAAAPFGRDTYLVAEHARISGPCLDASNPCTNPNLKYDAGLASLLDPAQARSLTNFGTAITTSGAVKRKFGFLPAADLTPIRAFLIL